MHNTLSLHRFILLAILVISSTGLYGISTAQIGGESHVVSPLPTPIMSQYAQVAIEYLSEKYNIPKERLVVEYEVKQEYLFSGRSFQYFKISDGLAPSSTTFNALVDLATYEVTEDLVAMEKSDEDAYYSKFGKLQSALYERLQTVSDDTYLPVAVWVMGQRVHTEDEILAILSSEFPEVLAATAAGKKFLDVDDPRLADEIQTRYEELLAENTRARIRPLINWLEERGYKWENDGLMPSLTAILPKRAILELSELDSVGLIYLIEAQGTEESDIAIPSDRAPAVWRNSLTGAGVSIAILDAGNIDTGTGCLTISHTNSSPQGVASHNTKTALIAACNVDPYRGIAYGATIVDAGFDSASNSMSNAVSALKWATDSTRSAKVVNVSYGWEGDGNINWTDRAFDYWVRTRNFAVTKSAGNTNSYITSPGKAWNVITVGGTNDQNSIVWSDDAMYASSNYIDPTGGESGNDREKPEVVAPAQNITVCCSGNSAPASGTSYAAPQVAGLAALMIHRYSQLQAWPEAIKSIIMASAVHNIQDDRRLSEYDGAGAIDATLADQVSTFRQTSPTAACAFSCWWGTTTSLSSPSVGSSLVRYFSATRGEQIRIVISWFSNADSETNNYSFDRLDTDFDLRIYTNGGVLAASSLSFKNNYEIVEFTASESTTYRIEVKKQSVSNNEANNSLGIALAKIGTYLPDIRNNFGNWTSKIYIRNDGARPRDVKVTFLNADGSASDASLSGLAPNATWYTVTLPLNSWTGAAIVDGSEDLSVAVLQERGAPSPYTTDTYAGVANPPTSVRVPIVQKGNSNFYSDLIIQNAGGSSTSVQIQFIPNAGSSCNPCTFTEGPIAAGGWRVQPLSAYGQLSTPFVGSAIITSLSSPAQPLAVASTQYRDIPGTSQFLETSNSQPPAVTLYAPLIQNNNSGWQSGLSLSRNDGSSLSVTYFNNGTGLQCHSSTSGNNPWVIFPAPGGGSCPATPIAKFEVTGSDPKSMVANVNQLAAAPNLGTTNYAAIAVPSKAIIIPKLRRDTTSWTDAFVVANFNTAQANISVQFYDASGAVSGGAVPYTVGSNRSIVVWTPVVAGGFHGSAVLASDQPVVVSVNSWKSGAPANLDTIGSYPAVHR